MLVIVSPNEVFDDIIVSAPPPRPPPCPRPPIDPDDVNALTRKIFNGSLFKFYMRVDTPLMYVAIEI